MKLRYRIKTLLDTLTITMHSPNSMTLKWSLAITRVIVQRGWPVLEVMIYSSKNEWCRWWHLMSNWDLVPLNIKSLTQTFSHSGDTKGWRDNKTLRQRDRQRSMDRDKRADRQTDRDSTIEIYCSHWVYSQPTTLHTESPGYRLCLSSLWKLGGLSQRRGLPAIARIRAAHNHTS